MVLIMILVVGSLLTGIFGLMEFIATQNVLQRITGATIAMLSFVVFGLAVVAERVHEAILVMKRLDKARRDEINPPTRSVPRDNYSGRIAIAVIAALFVIIGLMNYFD